MGFIWKPLLAMLFGCWHKQFSFPLSKRPGEKRSDAQSITGTYVVCLDCGKEFAYDWEQMRRLPDVRKRNVRIQRLASVKRSHKEME